MEFNCTLINRSTLHNVFLYAKIFYVLPSAVYLKFLLVALICGRHRSRYSSIFYKLIQFGVWMAVIVHVPHSVTQIISKRPSLFCPMYDALSEPTFWLTPYLFITQVADTLRILIATTIAFYRFHSIIDYSSSSKLWEGRTLLIVLSLIAISCFVYIPVFFSPGYVIVEDEEMLFKSVPIGWYSSEAVGVGICIACSIALIISQLYLWISGKNQTNNKANERMDPSLNIIGFTEIILVILYTIIQTMIFTYDHYSSHIPVICIILYLLISDGVGFLPPWLLFFISHNIREDATPFRRIYLLIKRKFFKKTEETPLSRLQTPSSTML